ncbi:MAG TPA: NUDIX domain-containing protein, partial [Treponemataceae bacterium]|nr:NUDIX domain-containing protein [Treponemataceae bacterium]
HRFFLPYLEGKIGQGDIPEPAAKRMLAMVTGFGLLTLAHAGLTAVAALCWSKAAWNFVAGALFWILSGLYVAAWTLPALIKARARGTRGATRQAEGTGEILPVVDGDGRVIGQAPRPLCHSGQKILHPVVRLWIGDGKGGYLMQKRSLCKLVQPGKWDCAVGGHISFGETAEQALARESREEIGLTAMPTLEPLMRFTWETAIERELVFVYRATLSGADDPLVATLKADRSEVSEIRLWTADEIAREAEKGDDEREFTELARVELARMRNNP